VTLVIPTVDCQANGYLTSFSVSPPLAIVIYKVLGEQRHYTAFITCIYRSVTWWQRRL